MMVGVLILLGSAMILRPTGGAMSVMATAFQGADDPSFMVRLRNREMIRSYIISNPVGYGLGATGALGNKYSSDTFIGTFQTDSEYVRIAVEAGSMGLLLWLTVLTVIFSYGVTQYFKTKDVEWRAILTVALVFLFMVMVAQYTQEIFTSFLIPMLMSSMFAIIAKIGTKIQKPSLQDDTE
jgi:O-antigen ligase